MAKLIIYDLDTNFTKPLKVNGELKKNLGDEKWIADFVYSLEDDLGEDIVICFCQDINNVFIILECLYDNKLKKHFYLIKNNKSVNLLENKFFLDYVKKINIEKEVLYNTIMKTYNSMLEEELGVLNSGFFI